MLAPLWDVPVVAHNAAFELSFLHRLGIEPAEMHCTMQAVRLLYGPNVLRASKHAAATVLGIEGMDKAYQTSDWSQPHLTAGADQIRRRRRCRRMAPRKQDAAPAGREGTRPTRSRCRPSPPSCAWRRAASGWTRRRTPG